MISNTDQLLPNYTAFLAIVRRF